MTEECITPLRRRMIEDMSVRHFASKTQHDYIRTVMKLTRFLGRSPDTATNEDTPSFPVALDREPRGRADYQLHRLGVAVLFHRDARSGRRGSASDVRPRAAQAAGRPEPRGGGARRQEQGRARRRLWRRPARLRGRLAKSLGYRQQAHDAARRAGQGRQGSSRDALATVAGTFARLVAHRAATSLAVSWA